MKFIMSYSCGKDSTLSLYRMIKEGHIPLGLLVTVDRGASRSFFHGIPEGVIEEVSKSLDIDLILVRCEGKEYKDKFEETLLQVKERGAEACVFGDIDLEAHRAWCTERCEAVGMKAIFPLWQENREELTYEFIDSGFKTILKTVRLNDLGPEFLGKILTKEVVAEIKETGSDPCGENGEYHTFVFDGPLFKNPVSFVENGKVLSDDYGYLDIR